jgi:hypothetical protein
VREREFLEAKEREIRVRNEARKRRDNWERRNNSIIE